MGIAMWGLLAFAITAAVGMQVYSIWLIEAYIRRCGGVIRGRSDLTEVKKIINVNMILAIVYIALYAVLFIMVLVMSIKGKNMAPFLILFIFGIVTLPVGLIGKNYEKKFKNLKIESDDPGVAETFQRWLVQWQEARFKLPD